jgi:ubiquinone/menaquinone biosynthesis C-methylase UbiE
MTGSLGRRVRYWDRQAPGYDRGMNAVERRLFPGSRQWVCSRAVGRTLEVAIGTGANLTHYPLETDLTGVDWSAGMLSVARERAQRTRRDVTLQQADAGDLPFDSATFDTVVSTFALCCIPDERRALGEAVRVLRPGGRLLLADHVSSSFWPIRSLQLLVDVVSVPLHGEHFTRRPIAVVRDLGVTLEETERLRMGLIEHVHARKNV